jgi:hypothetical protein
MKNKTQNANTGAFKSIHPDLTNILAASEHIKGRKRQT